jgi:hypothetical protein
MKQEKRHMASFKLTCRGCREWIQVVTAPEEASTRLLEFTREHREHYAIPIDEFGIAMEASGMLRGRFKRRGEMERDGGGEEKGEAQ